MFPGGLDLRVEVAPEQILQHGFEVKIAGGYCYAVVALVHFED